MFEEFFKPDPHLVSVVESSNAANAIVQKLPETNAVVELKTILQTQKEILECILKREHFGSRHLQYFISQCQEICQELDKVEKE